MRYNKKVLVLAIVWGLTSPLSLSSMEIGNHYMGQTYYKYIFAPKLGYDGAIFSKKFTKVQWQELFANGGEKFFKEFNLSQEGVEGDTLTHLKAFAIYYAKDSDIQPTCQKGG